MDESRKIKHLMWRAGCGLDVSQYTKVKDHNLQSYINQLFAESKDYLPISFDVDEVVTKKEYRMASKSERKDMRKLARKRIKNINHECLRRMAFEKGVLREKMVIFWHNHFASTTIFPGWILKQNNIIRKHALGNFGDLLMEVSKNPVMITYLNNQQNKKGHPNENFAREVMELFTLGRGNYTENDIKEAARAFTGWSTNLNGEFVFRSQFHDEGSKTIFGQTGNFKGEDIIKLLLEKPQTAKFVAAKVYKEFVSDEVNPDHVEVLAKKFFDSSYSIELLMKEVFTSDWFYDEKVIGSKIKSPIELLTGLMRSFNMQFDTANSLVAMEKIMGQVLFNPPNVAGWPGGVKWIDSSSLMFRLRMAEYIFNKAEIDYEAKEDFDMEKENLSMSLGAANNAKKKKMIATVEPEAFFDHFMQYDEEEMIDHLTDFFFTHKQVQLDKKMLEKHANKNSKLEYLTSLTVMILSSPQYQLC